MKKALIALSVAAGMIASAQAENTTTLYGSLGFETQVNKTGSLSSSVSENKWNLDTNTAKFGIKGTEDLSNGLQAFYKIEFGADVNRGANDTRYAYVGLTGNFGTVTFGKQDSLFKVVTNYNDIFQNNFYGNTVHYMGAAGGSRIPKVISYVSPNFNGFHFGLAGVLDGSNEVVPFSDSNNFVGYQAGLWYNQNGFYAGVAYSSLDVDPSKLMPGSALTYASDLSKSIDVVGAAVGFSNDQFKVGLGVQNKSGADLDNYVGTDLNRALALADGTKYSLAGEYYSGPNTFRAGFGVADFNHVDDNIYTYALGYQYNFSKRTYTYVEGEYIDWNDDTIDNGYTVRVGLRHDF